MTQWEDVVEDQWEDVEPQADANVREQFAESSARQRYSPMSHTGKTSIKPKAEYAPFVGMDMKFNMGDKPAMSPAFIPNPGGMFTHTGKTLRELSSGIKQMGHSLFDTSGTKNPYGVETEEMRDLYNKSEHSTLGQIAGEAALFLPQIATLPSVVGRVAPKLGDAMLRARSIKTPIGIRGATEGGTYAGVYHVDPDEESPWAQRGKRAMLGATLGGMIDAASLPSKLIGESITAGNLRNKASGSLPIPVRLGGAELFNQKSAAKKADLAAHSGGEAGGDDFSKYTKDIYETAVRRQETDIKDNASILWNNITGRQEPVAKGESLQNMVDKLKAERTIAQDKSRNALDDFVDSNDKVFINEKFGNDLANEFEDYVRLKFGDGHKTSHVKQLESAVDRFVNKSSAGLTNAKTWVDLQRTVERVMSDTPPNSSTGKAVSTLKRNMNDKLDSMVAGSKYGDDLFSPNGTGPVDRFQKSLDSSSLYNQAFNENPIIQQASKGDLSANQFSDELFGATNVKSTQAREDAIEKLKLYDPAFKQPLATELLQQTFSGQGASGKKFDLDNFLTQYGSSHDTGAGKPLFKSLIDDPKQSQQLNDLYKVGKLFRRTKDRANVEGLTDTTPLLQGVSRSFTPTWGGLMDMPLIQALGGKNATDAAEALRYYRGAKGPLNDAIIAGKLGGLEGVKLFDPRFDDDKY